MISSGSPELLPVMYQNSARHVCNFLKFSGYYGGKEIYWCTLVTEETPFLALPGPFALLMCQPGQHGFEIVSEESRIKDILNHLDTGTDGYVKDCDSQVLHNIVPLFRAIFPLKVHAKQDASGIVFSSTSALRTDLDKNTIHNTLANLYDKYIDLVRLCNFHEDLFIAQCDAYDQVKAGYAFIRGPIWEMQQGGGVPFMDYEQASNWLELASWQEDSEYFDSLDKDLLQKRIDFVQQLQNLTSELLYIGKPLLQDPKPCETLFEEFKHFAAFELVFNDDAAFASE